MRLGEVREMVIKGIWEWEYKKSGNEGGWIGRVRLWTENERLGVSK